MTGERKQEILQIAIEIIADEGYSSLTMRSLARASGMKLGALQYHFRTWDELLRSLVGVIESEIKAEWSSQRSFLHHEDEEEASERGTAATA